MALTALVWLERMDNLDILRKHDFVECHLGCSCCCSCCAGLEDLAGASEMRLSRRMLLEILVSMGSALKYGSMCIPDKAITATVGGGSHTHL